MMNDTSVHRLKVLDIVLALVSAALAASSSIAMTQPPPAAYAQQPASQTFTAKLTGKDDRTCSFTFRSRWTWNIHSDWIFSSSLAKSERKIVKAPR
jgi:hypothetical protein